MNQERFRIWVRRMTCLLAAAACLSTCGCGHIFMKVIDVKGVVVGQGSPTNYGIRIEINGMASGKSDVNGNYTISGVAKGGEAFTAVFSYPGWQSATYQGTLTGKKDDKGNEVVTIPKITLQP